MCREKNVPSFSLSTYNKRYKNPFWGIFETNVNTTTKNSYYLEHVFQGGREK
jgi:hypothetical protein